MVSITAAFRAVGPGFARLRAGSVLMGPAFVAAIAYVDPGNIATNISAGARTGYLLVWVVAGANLMAGLVQYLSAKLGVVTGQSLPEALRDRMPRTGRLAFWAQAEIVAMATDLAEVVGGAIALRLLFDLPLVTGAIITGAVSMGLLLVRDRGGARPFERAITGMLVIIAIGFVAGVVMSPPSASGVVGGLVPRFDGSQSVLLAAGILGATVMPHAVYLHSSLARDRHGHPAAGPDRRRILVATRYDVGVAMILAGAVNLAMLLVAASALPGVDTDTLDGAHDAIRSALGTGVAGLFAVGMLTSGLASTSVGSYAGAVIMRGLLRVRISVVARRLITLIPAIAVTGAGFDPTWALVVSQVVLSFGIPFALVPLVALTSRKDVMGTDANHRVTTVLAGVIAAAVIGLNATLIGITLAG